MFITNRDGPGFFHTSTTDVVNIVYLVRISWCFPSEQLNSCRCFSLFNEQQRPPVTGRTNLQSLCSLQSRLLIHTQLFRFPTKLQWFSPSEQLLDTRLVRIEFFPAGDFQRTDWTCLFSLDRFVPRCYFERYWSIKIIPFLSYVRLSCVWFSATHFKSRRPKTILTIYKT